MYEAEFELEAELEAELEDLMAILGQSNLAHEAEVIKGRPIVVKDPALDRAKAIMRREMARGVDDEPSLTDAIFWDRHKDLKGKRLPKGAPKELTDEWISIRNKIVKVWRTPCLMGMC
ncbi:MAG TPA: hypothetical protein VHN74_09460 [Candidatus Angelobacter sp.]|jgi:hypothetical protein|nr:hypothetical protein [Candidatus Angelobacter sp.]